MNASVSSAEHIHKVVFPIKLVITPPAKTPVKKDATIKTYLSPMKALSLSLLRIAFDMFADALLRAPVHIVVANGKPFRSLNPLICSEQTNDIDVVTMLF